MKTRMIRQEVFFDTLPIVIYNIFLDSDKHAAVIGAAAETSKFVGGMCYYYNEFIEAENVELVPGEKIVQKWRTRDWPEGYYSNLKVELKEKSGGTLVVLTQTGVPLEIADSIEDGWDKHFWQKIRDFLINED